MNNFNFIKEQFINKHKVIDNEYYLNMYLNFLLDYKLIFNDSDDYTENHHILPRSVFPEFINEEWNIIKLKYEDHKLAHLWLFKAINIRTYQRPLNWMMSYYKNKEELSNAAKKGWEKLKLDKIKYKKVQESRSNFMKTISSEEQRRRANIFWKNITDDEYIKYCNKIKNMWTEEKRNKKSEEMNIFYSDPNNIIKKSEQAKKVWDSRTVEERLKFNEKMNIVNKDIDKRNNSGKKIKKLWKTDQYLEKMKNRKLRNGKKIKIIKPDGDELIFEHMQRLIDDFNFSGYYIRKYIDTNIKIDKIHLNENNMFLYNCIIVSIIK